MGRMLCANCGNTISNTTCPNDIEYYLTRFGVIDDKKYDELIKSENLRQKRNYERDHDEELKYIDTWHEVNMEFGYDVWVCKNCKAMHIFSNKKGRRNEVERIYVPLDRNAWWNDVEGNK
jgi:hypothetical protein